MRNIAQVGFQSHVVGRIDECSAVGAESHILAIDEQSARRSAIGLVGRVGGVERLGKHDDAVHADIENVRRCPNAAESAAPLISFPRVDQREQEIDVELRVGG